ncbi:TPA: acyltransferase family protein [Klebsiella pneumoniae]|uniref:acyltransferase family protein n=1 Tax=Klebsiella pneumoniae TaxID=573 RepID=UPI000C7B684C|nr:acyltransferase [Klebsiella pneumoniae]PLI57135.1 acyltransferase [Klebsiella pneumoniae]
MLGVIRFFLASCVIYFHLAGQSPDLGLYAVNCFYVISGYLITLILHRTYHFEFSRFALNRFLRLYPTYWFSCFVGFIVISTSQSPTIFHPSYGVNFSFDEALSNVLMIPWAFYADNIMTSPFHSFGINPLHLDGYMFRIVTSSWSVAVEIVCYFLLWAFIARSYKTALLTMFLSIGYHWYSIKNVDSLVVIYSPFIAALLPFSIGALGYFISNKLKEANIKICSNGITQILSCAIFIILFTSNWYLNYINKNSLASVNYYVNNIIALLAIISLHSTTPPRKIENVCKTLGDLSYPMFLCQFFMGLVAWEATGHTNVTRGLTIFIIGYALSFAFGLITIKLIDRPVSKLRNKIRQR